MKMLTRRAWLQRGLGAVAAAASLGPAGLSAAEDTGAEWGLEQLGKLKPRPTAEIGASPLSVGFETLDRRHFEPEKTYPYLAQLGAKWARCQTGWCRCETVRGQFDFGWLDAVVDGLLKIGVQPWFNLGYGNKLYTPAADATAVGWAPVFDPPALEAWLSFTRAIAGHFGKRVKHWEIWNEPNITGFWKPKQPNAADYVALLKPTAAEIRRLVPGAVIIGGALAGTAAAYLKGCLEAGLAEHVDKVSYHPYRAVPESNYAAEVAQLRQLLAKYHKPIALWQGENGCPSQGGKGSAGALANLQWDETRQAKWLLRRILSDLRLQVELTSYYHTVDLVGYRGITNFKGLLRGKDYTPKPAFFAYQSLCTLFDAQTRLNKGLKLDLVNQQKVHLQDAGFVRDGRALHAYWFPANLQEPWTPGRITMQLALPPEATIEQPVLIDPLTGRVYRLPVAEKEKNRLHLEKLPLLDYPLLITDRSVVQLL